MTPEGAFGAGLVVGIALALGFPLIWKRLHSGDQAPTGTGGSSTPQPPKIQ